MALEAAALYGVISLVDEASGPLGRIEQRLGGFGGTLTSFGQNLQRAGMNISLLTAPLVALGISGVRTAASFQDSMNLIAARTGITGEALETVRQQALRLGADTVFSAQDAANAYLELIAAGYGVEESSAILPSVLDAAAASGEDLGTTSRTLTTIMASFGLRANDARRVINTLAQAAGASAADMGSLGEGFANVGGTARQFGLSVEDTAAILAVFSNNGLRGAEAGTQLRSMLNNMTRDTEDAHAAWEAFGTSLYDAQGNVRALPTVLNEMRTAMAGMSDAERITAIQNLAGTYGQLGLSALLSSDQLGTMGQRMSEQANASDVAATRMSGFSGQLESLRGSIEAAQTQVFTPFMNNTLTPLLRDHLIPITNQVAAWAAANPQATTTIIELVGGVALLGGGMTILGTVITTVTTGIGALLAVALSPLTLALIVGGGLVLAYTNNWGGFRDFVDTQVRPAVEHLLTILQTVNTEIQRLSGQGTGTISGALPGGAIMSNIPGVGQVIGGLDLAAQIGDIINTPRGFLGASVTAGNSAMGSFGVGAFGHRASGGPVSSGTPYIVGERGPEMFVPDQNGRIIPNGGGGLTINVMMPAEALRDESAARARGRDFGEQIAAGMRARGYAPG